MVPSTSLNLLSPERVSVNPCWSACVPATRPTTTSPDNVPSVTRLSSSFRTARSSSVDGAEDCSPTSKEMSLVPLRPVASVAVRVSVICSPSVTIMPSFKYIWSPRNSKRESPDKVRVDMSPSLSCEEIVTPIERFATALPEASEGTPLICSWGAYSTS